MATEEILGALKEVLVAIEEVQGSFKSSSGHRGGSRSPPGGLAVIEMFLVDC